MEKQIRRSGILLGILVLSFLVCRIFLFDWIASYDMHHLMALIAAALTVVFVLSDRRLCSRVSVLAYPVSYVLAHLFHSEGVDPGGGRTDNAWLLWIFSYISLVILAWIIEKLFHVKHRRKDGIL